MRLPLLMWLGSAALAAALSLGGPLTDLNEQLDAESKADTKATDEAKCWCKDVQAALDERLRNSESQISELEHVRDTRFYENVGLNVEVKKHQQDIDDHTEGLATADALSEKATKAHLEEKEETETALKSLRMAIEKVPEGNEVHGVLTGLEDKFASKLEDAGKEHERRDTQMKEMNDAKTEMLNLAKKGLAQKQRRVADGEVVIAQAKSDIAAFSGQRDADWELQGSLNSVCDAIADAATERINQRQAAVIAISEEKAKTADAVAMKAMSKIMLLKSKSATKSEASCAKLLMTLGESFQGDCSGVRERAEDAKRQADDNLAGAKKAAKGIMDLMDKSEAIEEGLMKVFNNMIMEAHLATSKGKLADSVKGKINTLGETADADLKKTPGLFDKVRAKAKESTKADMKVVTSLQMGAATAGKAVVDAEKCE